MTRSLIRELLLSVIPSLAYGIPSQGGKLRLMTTVLGRYLVPALKTASYTNRPGEYKNSVSLLIWRPEMAIDFLRTVLAQCVNRAVHQLPSDANRILRFIITEHQENEGNFNGKTDNVIKSQLMKHTVEKSRVLLAGFEYSKLGSLKHYTAYNSASDGVPKKTPFHFKRKLDQGSAVAIPVEAGLKPLDVIFELDHYVKRDADSIPCFSLILRNHSESTCFWYNVPLGFE
ncbi:hypothetical protein BX666DRAFT_2108765 [Dichotomocladium elegans]|nr:hypothetical protein BX666DRAFT_2108765 [Dichotomocladium elegans]